jgi:hypothetical protein
MAVNHQQWKMPNMVSLRDARMSTGDVSLGDPHLGGLRGWRGPLD